MDDLQRRYLAEVGLRLRWAGFEVCPEYKGLLPIKKDAQQLCTINMHGGVSYDPEDIRLNGQEGVLDQVRQIAAETLTYMRQMVTAPHLTANGLYGEYRVLAEFDNVVLAGHRREGGYGVEFITWERIQNGTGLWQGNYYENNYAAAKQEFATRSGLIPSSLLFTQEQLAVIFDAAQNMTVVKKQHSTISFHSRIEFPPISLFKYSTAPHWKQSPFYTVPTIQTVKAE